MPPTDKLYNNEQEEPNSHELSSTHYRPYQHPSSSDRNAFGDDSDSEDQVHHSQEDQEPPEFDVYKDFNNTGVRYTTLLHGMTDESKTRDQERTNSPPSMLIHSEKSLAKNYASVDQDLSPSPSQARFQVDQPEPPTTPSNKQKGKTMQFKKRKNRWKVGSIIAFVAIACLGVVIYFMIPRQPFISFEAPPRLIKKEDNHLIFSASKPTNFSFEAQLDLALDGRASYLPVLVRDFKVSINDLGASSDSVRVGTGSLAHGFTAGTKNLTPLTLDVYFEYTTKLPSDALWQAWRKACGNIGESTVNGTITRPSLQLFVLLEFSVLGMFGTRSDGTQITNVGCPAELPVGAPSF
ncbi:hypothetical protein PGT21_028221 [Puccinia graminis f. sp. tritici]|uniref:Uncharacterized protein n=1 Tax=Puccinia graminis f. sp. tritici TaxID=56615 RepID=A0A5B0NMF5_PUCGR|nr:hypothetical protein PGT21_028221 [Puccinia graminis f. sp. tritici]